ncbi:MAG TPA: serine/threonine-protein kinase [Kofleriaceae bacterium]|nr:serine/threonine-protein kinase [Kofleriaceae bacterium]
MVPATDPQRPEATRLGSYEILRKLARGGMAELFLARTVGPENFEKLVVLKKILPNFAENPKFVRLFLDEARLAATLDHPHIAHVYDMGKVDGNYFFTMEYIHGQDVRATLRRTARFDQKFPLDHTVLIVHAVAAALHYAHERRKPDGSLLDIVHRDVSPSNVLISYDGAIKLVDFGVAKAATSSVKTRTGTLKGKIAYMSPEQAKGSTVDRRSDVFALGIVLWEMITTQRLFKGDNDLATIQLIINSKPQPPRELRPECPEELERITMKALSNDPETRYQTAEELQLDLEELARELRLKQSSIALRSHMQELFAEEIKAWKSAQASGVTLMDHVTSASIVEMTTPVSENEISFLDDDDEDEDSRQQPTAEGVITATTPRPSQNTMPPIAVTIAPSVVVNRIDHTPYGPQSAVPVPLPPSPSGGVPRQISHTPSHPVVARTSTMPPMPIQHSQSGPIRMPTDNFPVVAQTYAADPNAFPIAPREWRENKTTGATDPNEGPRKRMIIGGLIGMAVLAVVLLATGGTSAPAAAVVEVKPEPVETQPPAPTQPIEMQVEPAPAPSPNAAAGSNVAPIIDQPSVAPTAPPPIAPAPTAAPSDSAPAHHAPAKAEEHHHHTTPPPVTTPPATTPPKSDPKHTAPVNRDSALPPP